MDDETNDDVALEEKPEPTLSPGFAVTIRGWENEDEAEARSFAEGVAGVVRGISRFFDLSRARILGDPLIAVVEDLLNRHGMFTRPHVDGIYVDMPMAHALDL